MTLVFAGVVGTALAQRAPRSLGRFGLSILVALAAATVIYWRMTGDLTPYMVLQLGAIVLLLALVLLTRPANDPFPWAWVIAWYALAKLLETFDREIWDATGGLVAGHALKHLAAAAASGAALWPLFAADVRRVEGRSDRALEPER
jgi:hypothetical protein